MIDIMIVTPMGIYHISYKYELHKFPVFSKTSDYVMTVHTTKCVCMYVCMYVFKGVTRFALFNWSPSGYTHSV